MVRRAMARRAMARRWTARCIALSPDASPYRLTTSVCEAYTLYFLSGTGAVRLARGAADRSPATARGGAAARKAYQHHGTDRRLRSLRDELPRHEGRSFLRRRRVRRVQQRAGERLQSRAVRGDADRGHLA